MTTIGEPNMETMQASGAAELDGWENAHDGEPSDPALPSPGAADAISGQGGEELEPGLNPELRVYRHRTVALLRRYMRLALEVGRLPSLLGREFFRSQMTSYRAHSFEDVVIFVHDVERSLSELSGSDQAIIGLIALREYSQEEAARLVGCTRRTIVRVYSEALDRTSEIFLKREILAPLPAREQVAGESCQGHLLEEILTSDSA